MMDRGPWGHAEFLDAIRDPAHERHAELKECAATSILTMLIARSSRRMSQCSRNSGRGHRPHGALAAPSHAGYRSHPRPHHIQIAAVNGKIRGPGRVLTQLLGDKGYNSDAVRRDVAQRGGEAVIPSTASRKVQRIVDKAIYALRNRIERFFNRAKNSRRIATRYDKLVESFAAFVLLACFRLWIKFVHAT